MPSIYALKPEFQNSLRPLMRGLARLEVSPNQVTLAAAALSLAVGGLIYWAKGGRMLLLLPLALLARMALNALDGMLARERHQQTALGTFLNELGDVTSDAALYLPLAWVPGFAAWLVALVVLLAVLTEMTGVVAVMIGANRRYDGPFGKSDRAFFFGLLGLLLGSGVRMERVIPFLLYGAVLLLVFTIFQRARRALRQPAPGGGSL